MASTSSALHTVSTRYATALLATAESANAVADVERDLHTLQDVMKAQPVIAQAMKNPIISRADQEKLIMSLATELRAHELTKKFLGVIAHNRRLPALPSIIKATFHLLSQKRGEMTAHVAAAQILTEAQQETLKTNLSQRFGAKIILEMKTDPSLLGGLVVTVGSIMMDDSVKGKLEQLKKVLHTQANQNRNMKEVG